MKVDLADTTTSGIAAALVTARRHSGSPAMGMVFTVVIVVEEADQHDAMIAAAGAAQEHPARVLGVILRGGRGPSRLDAEVRVGGEAGSGESVLMRFYGELARHAESVVMPLLLPESPVVAWWPGRPPPSLYADPIGALAQRRVADTAVVARPLSVLRHLCANYVPGDTDLAWTRLTPWRALLAAALDQHPAKVASTVVEASRGNASATLLATWLSQRLHAPARIIESKGPGITAVRMYVPKGEIAITRPDGRLAQYSVPGQPVRHVALKRRTTAELLAEELRRLDPDDIYANTVKEYLAGFDARATSQTAARRTTPVAHTELTGALPSTKAPAKKAVAKKAVAKKAPAKNARPTKSTVPTKRTVSTKRTVPTRKAGAAKKAAAKKTVPAKKTAR
jgi:glucose-6-phosphate dehydrogenase assembly protein OpcA